MNVVTRTSSITRPADTTQYTAGDIVSNAAGARHTFTELPIYAGMGGLVESAKVISSVNAGTKPDLELWLFSGDVAATADNAAAAVTDAQMLTLVGIVPFVQASWKSAGANAVCVAQNIGLAFKSDTLYGILIERGSYTPASAEVFQVNLDVIR